jgi:hypothetical protein
MSDCGAQSSAPLDPSPSSSLAEEERLRWLLLRATEARSSDARSDNSRLLAQCLIARSARADRAYEAAAVLPHSQTKSVSARSLVQDSGARSSAPLDPSPSSSLAEEERLR